MGHHLVKMVDFPLREVLDDPGWSSTANGLLLGSCKMLRVKALGASTRTLGDGGSDMENHHGDLMGISWNLLGIRDGNFMGIKKGIYPPVSSNINWDFPMDYPPAIKFRRKIPQISIFPTNLHRVWGFSNGHVWLPEGTVSTVWWFQPTPLKNHGVSKSWDDEIPQLNGKKTCSKPPTRLRWQLGIGTNDNGPGWKR